MGVAKGALGPCFPKYIMSTICLPFCQFYKKVILPLREHGDVIDTQRILLYLCEMHNNMQSFVSHKVFQQMLSSKYLTNIIDL